MNFRHRRHCGCPKQKPCNCQKPVKEIVHPVKQDVVNCWSEETVKHVHPSHTTVMKHHMVKNEHVFPHSTSVENTFNEMNVMGASSNMGPGSGVGGAMSPGMGAQGGKGVMGKKDCYSGNGVMGTQMGHHHHHHHGQMGHQHGPKNCHKQKPNMWW